MPSIGTSAAKRAAPVHLQRAVEARDRSADQPMPALDQRIGFASGLPAFRPERDRCLNWSSPTVVMRRAPPALRARRLIVRRASSILNALSRSGAAAASSASAAARKLSAVAGLPSSASSAFQARHGFVRDATERDPYVPDGSVVDLERGRDRDERERVARAVAHLAIGRVAANASGGQLDRGDQLAGLEHRLDLWMVARQR